MIKEVKFCSLTDVSAGIQWTVEISGKEALFTKKPLDRKNIRKPEEKKMDIRFIQSLDIFFNLCPPEDWDAPAENAEEVDRLFVKRDGHDYEVSSDAEIDFIPAMFEDLKRYFTCCFEGTIKPYDMYLHSFDGGGPEYEFKTEKKGIFTWYCEKHYQKADHEEMCGAGYDVIYSLFPMRKGKASALLTADSPICPDPPTRIFVDVSDKLEVSITSVPADPRQR